MDELDNLKNELTRYKDFIETINAEKVALDQQLIETLKSLLTLRKDLHLANEKANKLSKEIISYKEKEANLQSKLDELQKDNILDSILESVD